MNCSCAHPDDDLPNPQVLALHTSRQAAMRLLREYDSNVQDSARAKGMGFVSYYFFDVRGRQLLAPFDFVFLHVRIVACALALDLELEKMSIRFNIAVTWQT